MLHTVNKSPYETNTLESCLAHAAEGSTILLIEDGVYGAVRGTAIADKLTQAMPGVSICALEPDLRARGLCDKVADGIRQVDYSGFVELAVAHDKIQAWL